MNKLYWAAVAYTVLGLAGGLFFRELTKAKHFSGDTELSVVHTHFLALSTMIFLTLILFEKACALSSRRGFTAFCWTYNAGLAWTGAMMTVIGTRQVYGHKTGDALASVAGIGHITITIAFTLLFRLLYEAAVRTQPRSAIGRRVVRLKIRTTPADLPTGSLL